MFTINCVRSSVCVRFSSNGRSARQIFLRSKQFQKAPEKPTELPTLNGLSPSEIQSIINPTGKSRLMMPFLFTAGFSASAFSLAAIWEYENMRSRALEMHFRAAGWIRKQVQRRKQGDLRNQINLWWRNTSDEKKIYMGILAINSIVFCAWRIPRLTLPMVNYFCSNPFARAVCWPMVFSTFSHKSLLHFGANMYVLHSFSEGTATTMGKEHFLAFYLSAGVVSSLLSHVVKTLRKSPGISLGASGAIMGLLSYFCLTYPTAQLNIVFLPNFPFTAENGLKGLLAFDTLGLLLGWRIFDHAAHLGGALFGLAWFYWGQTKLWSQRGEIMNAWHNIRGSRIPPPPPSD